MDIEPEVLMQIAFLIIQVLLVIIQIGVFIIGGIGVWIAYRNSIKQSKLVEEQMKVNFFADYTKRYQKIILNFPESINEDNFDFDKLKKSKYNKTMRYMRAYFDLSAEEHHLHLQDKIDESTWKEWEEGIKFTFTKTAFKQAWAIVNRDSKFYPKFSKYIDEFLGNKRSNK